MRPFIIILIVIIIAGAIYYWTRDNVNPNTSGETVYCTMDARLCPDGSYVGRVPPNCEFERCPAVIQPTSTPTSTPSAS